MIKLIVFDCDGVMFDSKESNVRYYNDTLKLFGHPPMTEGEATYSHMATVDEAFTHIFRNYQQDLPEIKEAVREKFDYSNYARYMRMEPDLPEFLAQTSKNCKLAISTNRGSTMIPLLEKHNLKDYFLIVKTAINVTRPKPAPDGLLEILQKLECTPQETIFIGDSLLDKMQAEACGVELIAFKNKELEAKYHVNSFMEILSLPEFAAV